MNRTISTPDFPLIGIADLDRDNHELREQLGTFHMLVLFRNDAQNRILQRKVNHLIRLILRNMNRERQYLKKIGCSCSAFSEKSSWNAVRKIQHFNASLDNDIKAVLCLAAEVERWQTAHMENLNRHLRFHHKYIMIPPGNTFLLMCDAAPKGNGE